MASRERSRHVDTAQATFDVGNYDTYVATQSESALRHLASQYPRREPARLRSLQQNALFDDIGQVLAKQRYQNVKPEPRRWKTAIVPT